MGQEQVQKHEQKRKKQEEIVEDIGEIALENEVSEEAEQTIIHINEVLDDTL
jgi:hypothetical protein